MKFFGFLLLTSGNVGTSVKYWGHIVDMGEEIGLPPSIGIDTLKIPHIGRYIGVWADIFVLDCRRIINGHMTANELCMSYATCEQCYATCEQCYTTCEQSYATCEQSFSFCFAGCFLHDYNFRQLHFIVSMFLFMAPGDAS